MTTEAETVERLTREAGADAHLLSHVGGGTLMRVLLSHGQSYEVDDLQRFMPTPRRKTGRVLVGDVESLTDYIDVHQVPGTTVWIDREQAQLVAVLNDHDQAAPGWADHVAVLSLERTPEWRHWKGNDGTMMSQAQFAEHVQQGLPEIAVPDPATMLEVAQSIQGKTDVTWRTARRLDNGETGFEYVEEVSAAAGRGGSLEIPSEFTLNLTPFYGEAITVVECRLRYRIRDGVLSIGYWITQPHLIELAALGDIRDRLIARYPGHSILMGKR